MKAKIVPAVLCLAILAAMALALKCHYSQADSEDLKWILAPTAGIVEWITGMTFEPEAGTGFINREKGLIIAPACAGVNFLIISLLMGGVVGVFRLKHPAAMAFWIGVAPVAGYGLTLFVNALRIVLSMVVYNAGINSAVINPADAHRILGVGIYLGALYGYFYLLRMFFRRFPPGNRSDGKAGAKGDWIGRIYGVENALPLTCYLTITVLVPLVNHHAAAGEAKILKHFGVILVISGMVYFTVALTELFFSKFIRKIDCHETDHSHC